MRRIILMSSAAVVLPFYAWAETSNSADEFTCTVIPDCQTLGYTETACADNNGVKCPWGDTWFCPVSEAEICEKNGFVYDCKSLGFSNGAGKDCNKKFAECACSDDYVFKGGSCVLKCEAGSELGYILYSDMTRSAELDTNKTPIGVVVCSYLNGGGQAMALQSVNDGTKYQWGGYGTDIAQLENINSIGALKNYTSCENSRKIMLAGNSDMYPAVWAANSYSTEGTSAGDWCLPASTILVMLHKYHESIIDAGFEKAGGTPFTSTSGAWSSSEAYAQNAYMLTYKNNNGFASMTKEARHEVRPVIEF